jgi:hypothetical protein
MVRIARNPKASLDLRGRMNAELAKEKASHLRLAGR